MLILKSKKKKRDRFGIYRQGMQRKKTARLHLEQLKLIMRLTKV